MGVYHLYGKKPNAYPKDISVRDQEKPEVLAGNRIFALFRSEVSGKPGQPRGIFARFSALHLLLFQTVSTLSTKMAHLSKVCKIT